jgi:DNA-directed RNA polymerase subunit RPC12/RpoP
MLYPCYACSELNSCEVLLPLTGFCMHNWWERSVALDADAICSGCAAKRSAGTKATLCGTLKRKASYYCTKCKCQQPEDSFDPALLRAWRKHRHYHQMMCAQHSTESCAKNHSTVRCKRCGQDRHRPEYNTATLKHVEEANDVEHAVCLRCDSSALHGSRAEKDAAAQYKCNHCGRKRMLQEYSGVMHKKQHPQQMRCLDCQMPACRECKQRPALPSIHGIPTGTAYVCQRCVYPPYSRCHRTPRPFKQKGWNAKN